MRAAVQRPLSITALGLSLTALASPSSAQDLSGTWRVTSDRVDVTVTEWGGACGPRPESHRNATGREVTVRAEGDELVISGGRTYRTNRCWSDNRDVSLTSASHPSPTQWVISCGTPAGFGLGEQGTYRLTARDANHLTFRDETRYEWVIQGSNCRASSVLVREYERATPLDAGPPPPPPPPPPSRCATPGAPVALQLAPARRSTTAGERACFRARLVDANRCETSGPEVVWSLRRVAGSFDATLDRNCVVIPQGAGTGEFEVTAAAGAFSARAMAAVVTADRYHDIVAAQLEAEDASVAAGDASVIGNAPRVGAVAVTTPATAPATPTVVWALVGLSTLLAVAGGALLLRRRKRDAKPPAGDTLDPAKTAGPPTLRPADEPAAQPLVAPQPAPQPLPAAQQHVAQQPVADVKRPVVLPDALACPRCATRHPSDLAFCPHDGTRLVPSAEVSRVGPLPAAPVADATPDGVCPRCGRRYPAPTEFCGEDGAALVRAGS